MFKKWIYILSVLASSVIGQASLNRGHFSSDPLTEEDKAIFGQFIEDFANNHLNQLMENKQRLEETLYRFGKINLLTLTSFFFSEPKLHQYAKKIMETEGKSSLLLFALAMEIDEATQDGVMDLYVSEFADLLHLDRNRIQGYIDQENYKEMVHYMLRM